MTADVQFQSERTAADAPSETFGLVFLIAMVLVLGLVVALVG